MYFNSPGRKSPGLFVLGIVAALVAMSGCATIGGPGQRARSADSFAAGAGFKSAYVEAGDFKLLTYKKITKTGTVVRIYIEGDGKAWETRRRISSDPTPADPIALYLAAEDTYDNVAYIARPGQFQPEGSAQCDPTYWSQRRFSPEVAAAINKAIDAVKGDAGSSKIELVGFSGGGALAVLAASGRNDVASIRTVAGNLDHAALCKYHKVSPLEGSLNPIDFAAKTSSIPQNHFVGGQDKKVPVFIAENFAKSSGNPPNIKITPVKDASHTEGWREKWRELLGLH